MKKRLNLTYTLPLCLCVGLTFSARAAITGQWDFKAGNYNATIGQAMYPQDQFATANTAFGSTTSFGIPGIGGQPTNVMQFPQFLDSYYGTDGGQDTYVVPVGALANDGGSLVNAYTVIMDVLFTNLPAAGKSATLFATDNSSSGVGGEFFVNSSGAVGYSGGTGGSLTPNAWHRIAIAVDATNAAAGLSILIDGTNVLSSGPPSGLDGLFAIAYQTTLFNDAHTNSLPGYLASLQFDDAKLDDGFLAALGAPTASGIPATATSPWVVSVAPQSNLQFPGRSTVSPSPLIQIVLNDGANTVQTNTIVLKLDGTSVAATVTYAAPTTTISYQVPTFLASGSRHSVALSYHDSGGNALGTQYQFDIGPYIGLPISAANPVGSANTPGFIYRVAQAPVWATLDDSLVRAQQQLDGTLLNPTNGLPFGNEANLTETGVQPDGSYFVDQYEGTSGTVAFSTLSTPSLNTLPTFTAYAFPGIPGTNGSVYNFADDILAYLPLNAGTYVFGVAAGESRVDNPPDDGYQLFCGANPRDRFATLVGQYVRTAPNFNTGANTNTFTFVAPANGVYPFRLIHWQNGGQFGLIGDLAWYYVDPVTGNNVLINGPSSSIPAYRVSTIAREPYVAEVYPVPGGAGFAATAPVEAVLSDDDLQVGTGANGPQLFLNGAQVTPNSVSKNGKLTTILYNPNATRTTVTNTVTLVYSDNATPTAHSFTNSWSFTIVVGGAGVPAVTGQWDFDNCDLTATVGKDLKYFDGPNGQTAAQTHFGTCSSFGIPTINGFDATIMQVPGAINGSLGYIMDHQISPNGGGTLVNQYTIIYDMYYTGGTLTFFQCQNTNAPSGTDGSLFLEGGAMGQGSGGYTMNHGNVSVGWHRLAFAVDLSQNLITKWVDGVKAQDWVSSANSLDTPRRAWQPDVLLFEDNDGDDRALCYVNSIQVRNGKLSDAEMVALGGPTGDGIPQVIPTTSASVTGQWDFEFGDLSATVGKDLQYFDGTNGLTKAGTQFGTCSALGIPMINGVDAHIMTVPGAINGSLGYIMDHQIAPNGGGTKVNQYTIIYDMYYEGGTLTFFQCQNTNAPSGTDGSLFLEGGAMGQGSGGYTMNHGNVSANAWHRLAFAVDLSQNLITKWADGVKQQDWVSSANSLDTARRAWQPDVLLFEDNDGDDRAPCAVKSIQVRNGKMSDAEMVALGAPDGHAIPVAPPVTPVSGQWDFTYGDLSATIGKDLQYFDGPTGLTHAGTAFGTCSALGIPPINGSNAPIMTVPGAINGALGYIMDHQIAPNGGGTLVNQYTYIVDMYYEGGTLTFFQCQNTNAPSGTDGSLFLEGGAMGQGSGGYTMAPGTTVSANAWHRLAFAVDLSQDLITKWVDGVKAQDWVSSANSLDAARRAWQPDVLLFEDNDGDDRAPCAVRSIQVSAGKRSDAWMMALGAPDGNPIPIYVSTPTPPPTLTIVNNGNGTVTVSWPAADTGWGLEIATALNPSNWVPCTGGVVNNSITLTLGPGASFFRLHK